MSKEDEKQEARMWRVGIVAPGCTPEMAMDPHPVSDELLAAVVGEYSNLAPEEVVVFAFRSRSESFDERCATLAALVAVSIGNGDFEIGQLIIDLGAREASRIEALEADLAVSEHRRRDSDRLLAAAVRRKTRCVLVALAVGALLGAAVAWACFVHGRGV